MIALQWILNWFCTDGAALSTQLYRYGASLLAGLVTGHEPWLQPICFGVAWIVIITLASNLFQLFRDGQQRLHTLHQIPCSQCRYFTDDVHLKCTVHPFIALSEEAIGCADFESVSLK